MIISRYVSREISRPFLLIVTLFCVVFTSFSTAVVLNDVAAGLIPMETMAKLILIKLLIALEILLPVSLYFGVSVGLGRMHSDSEITAISACGVGEMHLVRVVFRLSLVIALIVASVSLLARPWAYHQRYLLLAQVAAEFEIADLQAQQFFFDPDSGYAILADTVDHATQSAGDVIVQVGREDATRLIVAKRLIQPPRSAVSPLEFLFEDGVVYHLDRTGSRDLIGRFKRLRLVLRHQEPESVTLKSKNRGTLALSQSSSPKDVAEFQWRLSTPVATVLLALLAVPLSRVKPRQGRFARVLATVLAYAVFYNLLAFSKNLVQEGLIGPIPGLWWPLALLAALLSMLLFGPWRKGRI